MFSFPRPRGDGPTTPNAPTAAAKFSPPTRGWPARRMSGNTLVWVFPAHAGMARPTHVREYARLSFPRPRGDGPPSGRISEITGKFSPPTRGWPEVAAEWACNHAVFPAHAGMARGSVAVGIRTTGFPRPRGDGPPSDLHKRHGCAFSPPTRGWPVEVTRNRAPWIVFPAHAGMARLEGNETPTHWSFPRPRGDGPIAGILNGTPAAFSPPTRGWPGSRSIGIDLVNVFPAHAGMARTLVSSSLLPRSFPRPRGDGPLTPPVPESRPVFSPPTRGWPAPPRRDPYRPSVFPAHAGMARPARPHGSPLNSFPRPRGDGPLPDPPPIPEYQFSPPTRGWPAGVDAPRQRSRVFPAHAGMARITKPHPPHAMSFPRPRGDGPPEQRGGKTIDGFSPPTRGWPGVGILKCKFHRVFPAHAGMARGRRPDSNRTVRFPRPRGDGPVMAMLNKEELFSPPTRGWPENPGAANRPGLVFPAHAGMAR